MADVASDLKTWSTTASSNTPTGSTTIGTGLAPNLQEIQKVVRQDLAHKGADIASATTMDIGAVAGLMHDITGTTTITGLGTVSAGIWKVLKFEGALTLTHNATSLILPGEANITTANGDVAIVISEGSGNWRCLSYTKVSGAAIVGTTTTAPFLLENIGLSVAMAANAVTIALKGANGSDPSSSNLVGIGFRNATLTNGQASKVQVSAATSTVISSGSTGGSVSAEASRVWIAAINNAGTVELAWSIRRSGTSILPIDEGGVISTSAEGGAGAADTAGTWYSTTARTSVPFTILGYFDSTQTTAGTWASSPTSLVVNPKHRPGDVVQDILTADGTAASTATVLPIDNTIPQNTEGAEFTQVATAITPSSASNLLVIDALAYLTRGTGSNGIVAALFQDSVADAIEAGMGGDTSGTTHPSTVMVSRRKLAGSTASTTFKLRYGGTAGTTYINQGSGGALFNGTLRTSMSVKELSV